MRVLYCPSCRSEFREGFSECATCGVALVEHLDEAPPAMDDASMADYLSDRDVVPVARTNLDALKGLKKLLCNNGIANIIMRSGDGGCSTGCSPVLDLVVAEEDVPAVLELMDREFRGLVGTVSENTKDSERLDRVVNLEAERMVCPACDEEIPAGAGECPSCGLFVGIPEEFV